MCLLRLCKCILHFLSTVAKELGPPRQEMPFINLSEMALVKKMRFCLYVFPELCPKLPQATHKHEMCWAWKHPLTSVEAHIPSPALIFMISYWGAFPPPYCFLFRTTCNRSFYVFQTFQGRWRPCIRLQSGNSSFARVTALLLASWANKQHVQWRGRNVSSFTQFFKAPVWM